MKMLWAVTAVLVAGAGLSASGVPTSKAPAAADGAQTLKAANAAAALPKFDLLDRKEIRNILFHPRRVPEAGAERPGVRVVYMTMPDGVRLAGRLHMATATAPLLLFFHGNGEVSSDYDVIGPVYTNIGVSFLVMDFRGYGMSAGSPSVATLVADAGETYRQLGGVLTAAGAKPAQIYVMGRSLGGVSAIEVGRVAGDRLAGLILESAFAETQPLLLGLGAGEFVGFDEARDGIGNQEKIKSVRVPTLIIHGAGDKLIPLRNAETLHANSGAADKRLVVIPTAGHNDVLVRGQQYYFAAIRNFIASGVQGRPVLTPAN